MSKEKKIITFVCTGNTCRSPMAEFMFKAYLKEKKRYSDFSVQSAGLYAERGDVLTPTAHEALDTFGVKHNPERKAKPFTVQMAEDSALIVAMSARHAELCGDGDNIVTFEELIGSPISDPFGGPLPVYLACAEQMRAAFPKILELADKHPGA